MSQSYKLLFRDRKQFVFEETSQRHSTAIMTLILGFVLGSLLGVYFASLDLVTAGSILLAIGTYVTVITSTFSLRSNPLGVVIIFLSSFGAVILLTYVSRLTLNYLQESRFKLVLVYAGLFAIIAEVIYLWSRLTWVEDTRMHQLILDKSSLSLNAKISTRIREPSLRAFSLWILQQIKFFVFHIYYTFLRNSKKAREYPVIFIEGWALWSESKSQPKITIENETLKRVKICIYHWSDYCCWVPIGGILGGMHVLDRGEEISFSPDWPSEVFRVKIFAHGMIDYELASHSSVTRGLRYKFIDVAKPITALSIQSPPPTSSGGKDNSTDSIGDDENSSSETSMMDGDMYIHIGSVTHATSSNGLRRVSSSRANLCLAGSAPSSPNDSTNSLLLKTPLGSTKRKRAFKDFLILVDLSHSIAVLNESTSDIKVIFYNIEDVSFVRALDSFRCSHSSSVGNQDGPVVPKGDWKIFELSAQETLRRSLAGSVPQQNGIRDWDRKFCMRVKSAAMELSYCTAVLGDALVVRDPIVTG